MSSNQSKDDLEKAAIAEQQAINDLRAAKEQQKERVAKALEKLRTEDW